MQTLLAACSKTESKIFALPQTPSRGAGWPKFNQLEMVITYKPSLVRIDACIFKLSWYQTLAHIHPQTGPITILCAAVGEQCNNCVVSQKEETCSFYKDGVILK